MLILYRVKINFLYCQFRIGPIFKTVILKRLKCPYYKSIENQQPTYITKKKQDSSALF